MRSLSATRFVRVLVLGASLANGVDAADTRSGSIDFKGRAAV
jgi:hypothetical protein